MQLEKQDDVVVVRMNAGKANAMNSASLDAMDALVREAASKGKAIVLVGYERFFSAGLDLPTLLSLDRATMQSFMRRFSDVMLAVFTCPRPVVAAVNGHAIAGGCVLALQADHRVMVSEGAKIGLTEAALGIGLPSEVIETLRAQVPASSLLPIALEGKLLSPSEAHRLGLVHEIVGSAELEARALAKARELAQVPSAAYAQLKDALRRPVLEAVYARRDRLVATWLDTWFSPEAQERLQSAVKKLK